MAEEATMDSLLGMFGISDQNTQSDSTNAESETQSEETTDTSDTENTNTANDNATNDQETETDTDTDLSEKFKGDKQHRAFAEMRVKNKKQAQLIQSIANALKIPAGTDDDAIIDALNKVVTQAQAKQQGIPPELLTQLQNLQRENEEYRNAQIELAARKGFQTLKDTYHLSDTELGEFAQALANDGLNPYVEPINLVNEYKLRNFDKLIAQAKEEGIHEEAARASKAAGSSTSVNDKHNPASEGSSKINTMSELEAFLNKK